MTYYNRDKQRTFKYLASPYSSPDAAVMEQRYNAAKLALATLLSRGLWVYSPIVHCHHLVKDHALPSDAESWRDYNYTMIDASSGVWVLTLPGWKQSVGVDDEINYALNNKPIHYVSPERDYEQLVAHQYLRVLEAD